MKAIKLMPALLWLGTIVAAISGSATHAQLELPASGVVDDVKAQSATRPDADFSLDPADLLASDAGFEPFDPVLDESSGPVWLKLQLSPSPESSGRYVLRVARRFFDHFDYYIQAPGQSLQSGTLAFNAAVDAELVGRDYVILRELSQRCSAAIRERDVLCRLGGDEFVIVLADQADGNSMEVADRIIAAVADTPFTFEGQKIGITTSVGVVSSIAPNAGVSEILRMADQSLYQAKQAGRNRATEFDPDRDSPFRHGTSLPHNPQEQR